MSFELMMAVEKLRGTEYDDPELTESASDDIEIVKRNFKDDTYASWLRIDSYAVTNEALSIHGGKLKLTG